MSMSNMREADLGNPRGHASALAIVSIGLDAADKAGACGDSSRRRKGAVELGRQMMRRQFCRIDKICGNVGEDSAAEPLSHIDGSARECLIAL